MVQQRRRPVVNVALAEIVERTGLSLAAIADRVNDIGAQNGVHLRYGGASISHWLNGTTPRKDVIPLIVEVLARGAHQPDLTAGHFGWPEAAARQGPLPTWDGDPVTFLAKLAREDTLDPRAAIADPYTVEALSLPEASERARSFTDETMRPADTCDVAHIWTMTRSLHLAASEHGGGRGRSALSAYLADASDTVHRLTLEWDTIASPQLRREMTTLRNMLNARNPSAVAEAGHAISCPHLL